MRKAILVGVKINNDINFNDNLLEMINLAEACNIEVIKTFTQSLHAINKSTYINKGKCEEILENIDEDIDLILFDKELSPSQNTNLETYFDCDVLDKTGLILEIFALRAKTKEAKIQVEIARLKYMLPRLSGSYEGMDRQGGIRNKGTGETKLEIDTRHINERIKHFENELVSIENQRSTQMKQRKKSDHLHISLVGYTNAGKSSLLNALLKYNEVEDKNVFEQDMLFATLTTNTRKIKYDKHTFLVSDTVGFVSDLPHTLIQAFHSTLQEALDADVLLEVIDFHDEQYKNHMDVTKETLDSIGANDIPILYVFNKCDLTNVEYPYFKDNKVYISAKDENSIPFLLECIKNTYLNMIEIELLIPYYEGKLTSYLFEKANILESENKEDGIYIKCEVDEKDLYKVQQYSL